MKVSVSDLFSVKRVEALRAQIRNDRAANKLETLAVSKDPSASPPSRGRMKEGADTEYLATADSEGNLVSFIESNFMGYQINYTPPPFLWP